MICDELLDDLMHTLLNRWLSYLRLHIDQIVSDSEPHGHFSALLM